MSTPNMGLTLPTDHGSADVWDTILDAVFNTIDSHDHTTGKGVKVPSAALNINADVSWSSAGTYYALKDAKALDMQPTTAASVAGYSSVLYVDSSDGELHWIDGSARNAKLTLNGSINASLVGGIGGDYSSVGALFSYDDATRRYLAQQEGGPRPWAGIAGGNLDIYQQAASITNRVRQKSPNALAASYDMTWFTGLPGAQSFAMVDNTGQWFASNTVPGAVTFSSAVTLTGGVANAVTLTGGFTVGAAAVDLSAATSFKRPSRDIMVDIAAGIINSGAPVYGGSFWTAAAGGNSVDVPLTISPNEQITAVTFYYHNVASTPSFTLGNRGTTGVNTALCSKTVASATGDFSVQIGSSPTVGSLPQTTDNTHTYLLSWLSSANGDKLYAIKVTAQPLS